MHFAYTDPGTGSMIVQVAIAGAAGLAVAAKAGWERTANRLRRQRDSQPLAESSATTEPEG